MSLPPTFSTTPPAIDDDTDEGGEGQGRSRHAPWSPPQNMQQGRWGSRIEEYGQKDMWVDSDEEEDGEYSAAKRLLARVSGKR